MADTITAAKQHSNLVIELDTHDRPQVEIGGEVYHLKAASELSLDEQLMLREIALQMQGIDGQSFTRDSAATLADNLRQAADWINHDIPEGIMTKLSDQHRIELLGHFGSASTTK